VVFANDRKDPVVRPKIKLKKVAHLRPSIKGSFLSTKTTHFTTISPANYHQETLIFSKPASKNARKTRKITTSGARFFLRLVKISNSASLSRGDFARSKIREL
jgi:hypothetical protein